MSKPKPSVVQKQIDRPLPTSGSHRRQAKIWQFLIFGCVAIGVVSILLVKQAPAAPSASLPVVPANSADELPEVQLMQALQARKPILAFFHSMTCDSCKEMSAIVAEVYPDYAAAVELVDVDVYDERNTGLVRSAGIRAIPTVIFFDRSGASRTQLGVVTADDLRQILAAMQQGS